MQVREVLTEGSGRTVRAGTTLPNYSYCRQHSLVEPCTRQVSRWYSNEQKPSSAQSTNSMSHQDSQVGRVQRELRQACTTEVHTHTHTKKARHTTSTAHSQLHASSFAHCAVSSSIADSDPTPASPVGACIVHGTLTDGGRVHCAPTTPGVTAWASANVSPRGFQNYSGVGGRSGR